MRSIIFKIGIVSIMVSLIAIILVSLASASANTVAVTTSIPTSTVTTSIPTSTVTLPIPAITNTTINIGTSCTIIP